MFYFCLKFRNNYFSHNSQSRIEMDLSPFKKDIDDLIDEFAQVFSPSTVKCQIVCLCTTVFILFGWLNGDSYLQKRLLKFADMKRVWLSRKFSFIYEGRPNKKNTSIFMQGLYAHCIGTTLPIFLLVISTIFIYLISIL